MSDSTMRIQAQDKNFDLKLVDNGDNTFSIAVVTEALVTGDIEIGAVELKDGATDTRAKVKSDGTDNALVVVQNALPLPTGAATAAKQDTGNTSLGTIAGKDFATQTTLAEIALDTDNLATINTAAGAISDAAVTSDANGSRNAFLRGLVKIFADVYDSVNHFLRTALGNIDTVLQNAATTAVNGTAMDVSAMAALRVEVTGTYTGLVINWEGTIDGTTWEAISMAGAAGVAANTASANGMYSRMVAGFKQFRARISAISTGSVTVTGHAVAGGIAGHLGSALFGTQTVIGDTAVKADANGNLLTVAQAGENHVGSVGGLKSRIAVEKTRPADTTAYTAKDNVSESTSAPTVWTFTNIARLNAGSGYIVKATLMTDQTTNTESFRLHLFNTAPTAINDNAACSAPLYGDVAKYIGTIDFPAAKTEGTGATAAYANVTGNIANSNLPMSFVCANGDRNIYALLETPNGFTPASGQKIQIILVAEND